MKVYILSPKQVIKLSELNKLKEISFSPILYELLENKKSPREFISLVGKLKIFYYLVIKESSSEFTVLTRSAKLKMIDSCKVNKLSHSKLSGLIKIMKFSKLELKRD
jgi:hypothetical protein